MSAKSDTVFANEMAYSACQKKRSPASRTGRWHTDSPGATATRLQRWRRARNTASHLRGRINHSPEVTLPINQRVSSQRGQLEWVRERGGHIGATSGPKSNAATSAVEL